MNSIIVVQQLCWRLAKPAAEQVLQIHIIARIEDGKTESKDAAEQHSVDQD